MGELRIVSDSSMDMPPGWDKEYAIDILPVNIQFGEKTFRQGIDLNKEQFYRMVNDLRMVPRTSLPSPAQIIEFYRKIAKKGDSILSLHVASKMSGTFNAVQMAAREIATEFEIFPFDSGNGSAGLAYMCKEARLMERAGASIQEITNKLEIIRQKITIVMTLDNLEFARMSGRVSMLTEKLSAFLQIKPVVMLKDGMLDVADRVRTRKKAIDRIIEIVKQKVGEQKVNMAIVHAQDQSTAKEIMEKVKQRFNIKEMIMTDLSISVAANLGPGTVGIIAYPCTEGEK